MFFFPEKNMHYPDLRLRSLNPPTLDLKEDLHTGMPLRKYIVYEDLPFLKYIVAFIAST